MNIATAKEQIKDTVEAYLKKDDAGMYEISPSRQRPVFLLGAPGIGKTAIMEQIAQELQIGIVSYSMTHHTRQSALGLPRIVHREYEGFEYEASEYTMSEIVASVYDYMNDTGLKRGILFLDEINCVSETLYPSMLQFLQFKTFGRHRVPSDWVIVCAGNPPEYNKSVHEFDIVTLDRLREIEVEPEYGVWRKYAQEKGLHPAVTTFLEAKQDCFYKVESRPGGGKSFVTARGWEDLAETIALYEKMDKKVDRSLAAQFLRDDDVADKFSVYYKLFEKYRSDYQVGRILAGEAGYEIANRAKKAEFDERVALLSLLLDALATSCGKALDQEAIVLELRDELRRAKSELLAGATVEESVAKQVHKRESALERKVASGAAKPSYIRQERLVNALLRSFIGQCTIEQTLAGDEAFATISRAYKVEVGRVSELVDEANAKMDNAFDFIEATFTTGREMLVFMAELTTRRATTQFVAHYGNEKYYAHNDELQVDTTRSDLSARIAELEQLSGSLSNDNEIDMGASVGLGTSAVSADVYGSTVAHQGNSLADYYGAKQFEYGFASMSKMTLPVEKIAGKRVLDVCCRRGKGVYKLSANVKADGFVVGVDWSKSYVEEAKAGMERAYRDNGFKKNNMEFLTAYPEDLGAAGLGDATFDAVYINNVATLLCDPKKAFSEFFRVLKPGGLLICETIFSDAERDDAIVEKAREIGNSIQAGRTREEFDEMMAQVGFGEIEVVDEYDVDPKEGFKKYRDVEVVPSDEKVQFKAVALNIVKSK